jgi:hypothetical protein
MRLLHATTALLPMLFWRNPAMTLSTSLKAVLVDRVVMNISRFPTAFRPHALASNVISKELFPAAD